MRSFTRYLRDLYCYVRNKIVASVVLMVVLGLTEGIGVLMLIPFFSLAGIVPAHTMENSLAVSVQQFCQRLGLAVSLPLVLALYTGIIFAQSWLKRYQSILNVSIQQNYTNFLSVRLFKAAAEADWLFFLSKTKSDITHVLTGELMRVSAGTTFFLQILATACISLIQVLLAFWISPGLTLLTIGGGVVLFVCLYPFVKESRRMGSDISANNRELYFEVTEHLNGVKEIKSYGLEPSQIQSFARLRQTIADNFVQFTQLQSRTDMIYKVGAAVFISGFFYTAISVLALKAEALLLIVIIFSRLWPRFSSFQVALQHVVMMLPAFQTVIALEQQCAAARELVAQPVPASKLRLAQGVALHTVSFRYPAGGYAVRDIELLLPAGSTTAFVGASGSGKSTLADLLIGLLTPQSGEILLDGVPMQQQLQAWRQSIGYVPQDAFLFNASIRDNLQWACPEAEEASIWQALSMAAVDDFVKALPQQLDTVVGDRGVRLSGGERQRIVLARALLRQPSFLLLDEATSSLDNENERRIQQAIEGLHGKLTIVVIAHRVSTIKQADQIYVLENGCVVESGTYQTLADDAGSHFYRLACLAVQ